MAFNDFINKVGGAVGGAIGTAINAVDKGYNWLTDKTGEFIHGATGIDVNGIQNKIEQGAKKIPIIGDVSNWLDNIRNGIPDLAQDLKNDGKLDNDGAIKNNDKMWFENEEESQERAEETKNAIENETPKEEDGQTMSIDYDKINEIVENANKRQDELTTKMWEREDKIRAETQEREDNAYQRAIKDMRKAGINPNLINISPAQSGGGITQASKAQETSSTEINNAYQMILNAINNDKEIKENQKDRLNSLISTALHMFLLGKFVK